MKIPDGWIQQPDGSWSHPSRVRGAVEASQPEPGPGRALERDTPKRQACRPRVAGGKPTGNNDGEGGNRGEVLVVHLHARLARLMDGHDNLRASLKPLVDGIAASLGVPDNHPRLEWDYSQSVTRGEPCVVVSLEAKRFRKKYLAKLTAMG